MTTTTTAPGFTAEAYSARLFSAGIAAFETLSVYVGDRMGWFRSLVDEGPATASELAHRTGTAERYCREWLEMQAVFGTLTVEHDDDGNRFTLPEGPAEVLTDEHSLAYLAPLPQMIASVGPQLPNLLRAYRDGSGVSWAEFGSDARDAQGAINRPWFESQLAPALNGVDSLKEVLTVPGARIADIGCGLGWSTIALARAYPSAVLFGFDVDVPSIDAARAVAEAAGVADRVSFQVAEAETLTEHEPFDAAFAFECLHDMPRPVEVLTSIRRGIRPGGLVVVMDEAVADRFEAPGDEVEQVMYGYSLFICLPDGLSSTPSAGTGTVFRQPTLAGYARQAGFSQVSVLPIEDFAAFRFYQLHS